MIELYLETISQTRLTNSKKRNKMLEKNNNMINEITELVTKTKNELTKEINKSIVFVYWNIGRIITSNEDEFNNRLEYGKEVLKVLSDELTKYLGKGYSISNLKYMRMFYKAYPNFDIISPFVPIIIYRRLLYNFNNRRYF